MALDKNKPVKASLRKMIRHGNGSKKLATTALVCSAIIIFSFAIVAAALILKPKDPYTPLYGYETRQVVDENGTVVPNPVVHLSDPMVRIRGTKCSEDRTIITGQLNWLSVEPPGQIIPGISGQAERDPGCITRTYENTLPQAVIESVRHQLRTRDHVTWSLTGEENAIDKKGQKTQTITYRSVNFDIVE